MKLYQLTISSFLRESETDSMKEFLKKKMNSLNPQ